MGSRVSPCRVQLCLHLKPRLRMPTLPSSTGSQHDWLLPTVSAVPCDHYHDLSMEVIGFDFVTQLQTLLTDKDLMHPSISCHQPAIRCTEFFATCELKGSLLSHRVIVLSLSFPPSPSIQEVNMVWCIEANGFVVLQRPYFWGYLDNELNKAGREMSEKEQAFACWHGGLTLSAHQCFARIPFSPSEGQTNFCVDKSRDMPNQEHFTCNKKLVFKLTRTLDAAHIYCWYRLL